MRANAIEASATNFNLAGRGRRLLGALCTALALALALSASSASAAAWVPATPNASFSATAGGFAPNPTGLAVDQSGNFVYVSLLNGTTLSQAGPMLKFGLDGIAGSPASFGKAADGVAFDASSGNVYGLDDGTLLSASKPSSIQAYDPATGSEVGSPIPVTSLFANNGGRTVQIASDAAGNVYFPSLVSDVVQRFKADGTPLSSLNGSGPNALNNPHSVAIDNAGNVYVADSSFNEKQTVTVDATGGTFELSFGGQTTGATGTGDLDSTSTTVSNVTTSTGTFVAGEAISGPGIPAGTTISSVNAGAKTLTLSAMPTETKAGSALAADLRFGATAANLSNALQALSSIGAGNVAVASSNPYTVTFQGKLAGTDVAQMTANGSGLTGGASTVTIATPDPGLPGRVMKFDEAGAFKSVVASGVTTGLGVDPVNGTIFVVEGKDAATHVVAYTPAGVELDDFGLGDFKAVALSNYAYSQVAVDSATGRVYATDPGAAEVQMYDPLPPPAVETKAATLITQTGARLNATVNAEGLEADCSFEYDDDAGFGSPQSAPCIPNPVIGDTDTPVFANLSGLTPNTTYHFHVVAENEGGSTTGSDLQFTTKANPPLAQTGSASGISQTIATLNATVDASGADAACQFEWGTSASYGNTLPCSIDPVTGSGETAVTAALSGLSPGTTYHYRVSATNTGGSTNGADQTFSTLAHTCATNPALCPPPPPPPSPPVVDPPPPPPADNTKARNSCVAKAGKAHKNAIKAANKRKGAKAKAKAKKAANKRKQQQLKSCRARFR